MCRTVTPLPRAGEPYAALGEMRLGAKFSSHMLGLLIPGDAWAVSQFLLMTRAHAEIPGPALLVMHPRSEPSRALVKLKT